MSDTNFRPASSKGNGAGSGSASDPGPQHPRGSGRSYEAESPNAGRHARRDYMDRASDIADDAWRAGKDYYEQGSRRVSHWASEHPNQLWAAIAITGAFALWMAYRPAFSPRSQGSFDPSRYRYRRLPKPAGRAPFMEGGAASATSRRGN